MPAGTFAITYRPTASEVVVRTAPVVVDVRVIVAPGTTEPLGSVTVPVMRPVSVCANTVDGAAVTRLAIKNARRRNTVLKRMTICSLKSSQRAHARRRLGNSKGGRSIRGRRKRARHLSTFEEPVNHKRNDPVERKMIQQISDTQDSRNEGSKFSYEIPSSWGRTTSA